MSSEPRVLVVGTTPDYVDWIRRSWPGRAVFITETALRQAAAEESPDPSAEMLADLRRPADVLRKLQAHLRRHQLHLSGVACFDCESMLLAAHLAEAMSLPYPSKKAVRLCRNKLRCKQVWIASSVPCPEAQAVRTETEAVAFQQRVGTCVLKPLTGSGSELVFFCDRPAPTRRAVRRILQGLQVKKDNRLYAGALREILAEQFVAGPEYSCDALLGEGDLRIIRLSRKIPKPDGPFGAVRGYVVPAELPDGASSADLEQVLRQASAAVGLADGIFMADFLMTPGGPVLLELTPRPGGDCLPDTIRHASGVDMLGLALDVAEGRTVSIPDPRKWQRSVGLRIHARKEGLLRRIDTRSAGADARVCGVYLRRRPGHRIVLPPTDYDGWILGHIVFRPEPGRDVSAQCDELLAGVRVAISGEAV